MNNIEFSRKLIKGKISELIFQRIFESSKDYIVVPFGYEHTQPVLKQYTHVKGVNNTLTNIRNAPDFALIHKKNEQMKLVEVKYRTHVKDYDILKICKNTLEHWDKCWLFLVTPEAFYFGQCKNIKELKDLRKLSHNIFSEEFQEEYLKLLREFL